MGEPQRFGSFALVELLAELVDAEVWLARPLSPRQGLPDLVVLKRFPRRRLKVAGLESEFRRDAVVAATLETPYLSKTFEVGAIGDQIYVVREWVDGWSWRALMDRLRLKSDRLCLDSVAELMDPALRGIEALHALADPLAPRLLNFVHRDLSPDNLIVDIAGRTKLVEIGLSRSTLPAPAVAGAEPRIGTLGYMAPEQVAGGQIDQRADVYAMGMILWELLTLGLKPAPEASQSTERRLPSHHHPQVGANVDALVARATASDPEDRFQSAFEFRHALRTAIPGWDTDASLTNELLGWVSQEDDLRQRRAGYTDIALGPLHASPTVQAAIYAQAAGIVTVAPEDLPTERPAAPKTAAAVSPSETPTLSVATFQNPSIVRAYTPRDRVPTHSPTRRLLIGAVVLSVLITIGVAATMAARKHLWAPAVDAVPQQDGTAEI